MDLSNHLSFEAEQFSELRRRLIEADPEIDERTLFDTLEGATNLREAIAAVIRSALADEALALGLRSRLQDMKTRLARFEQTADAKRRAAQQAMESADLPKLIEPDFTVSLRRLPPNVVILSEAAIPDCYFVPQPPKLDRRAVHEALENGETVTGATLSNSFITLSIRSK
jgi:hypothetical protein